MNRTIETPRRAPLGVWGLALLLPTLHCAMLPSRANDPFDAQGVPLSGATSAAEVHASHLIGAGTLTHVLVPCGESRFVGYYGPSGPGGYSGTSPTIHRIDVGARAESVPGTLLVRVTAPDGLAVHEERIPITATDTAGQRFDVRVQAGPRRPDGTWIVELHADGACRAIRLALSMHSAPISGP